jgi:hypothetical protein
LLSIVLFAAAVFGQETTGGVQGTVKDWPQVSFPGQATADCLGSVDHSFPEQSWFRQETPAVKAVVLVRLESPEHLEDHHFEQQEVLD